MKCPACGNEMTEKTIAGTRYDVCEGGCGGVWFDWFELKKVDEPGEAPGEQLLDVPRDESVVVDASQRRRCPRDGQIMLRHYFSVERKVQVDECPECGGFWLDAGELRRVRSLGTEEEQREAARELFGEMFDDELDEMRGESDAERRRARRFAHMFRFICPSYYIPGKQEWGAH